MPRILIIVALLHLSDSMFLPENENEERKKTEKNNHIVHSSEHDHKLSLKSRKESDKLEYSE